MSRYDGTAILTRMALRRDRIVVPAWLVTFVAIAGVSAAATKGLYPDESMRARAGEAINATPALVALYGPVFDVTSLGSVALLKLAAMGDAMVGLLCLLLVVRHTRADEEVGRTELAAAGPAGRHAPLTSALLVASGTALALGVLTALALAAAGLPVAGSAVFGASWAACGIVFAAVGAVAAQLSGTARGARGLAVSVLCAAYLLRAVGDTSGPAFLTWLSPVGWSEQMQAYAADRWWPALLSLAAAIATAAVAVALGSRRDLGSGLLTDRAGPATGRLPGPLALAWRLHRAALLGWAAGFALLGVVLGSIAGSVSDFLDNPQARAMMEALGGEKALVDTFFSAELDFGGLIAAGFGISVVLRLAAEETQGRTEAVLAAATGRVRWALAHLAVAVAGSALLVAVLGLSAGASRALDIGEAAPLGDVLGAALARIPAVAVMTCLALLLYGVGARRAPLAWAALVGVVVAGELGPVMDLPDWVQSLSPYRHVPDLPGGTFSAAPVLWLSVVAVGFASLGAVAFRRRDVVSG
jgi:ABC-2 type transport system permease protein